MSNMFENNLKMIPNTVIEIKDLVGTFKSTGEFVCTDPCYTESRLFTKLENMKSGKYTARLGLFIDKEDLFDQISSSITNKLFQLILNETQSHKIGLFYIRSLSDKKEAINLYKNLYEHSKNNGNIDSVNKILKNSIDKFIDWECDDSELSYTFLYDLIENNLNRFKDSLNNIVDFTGLSDDYLVKSIFINVGMMHINPYSMSTLDVLDRYINNSENDLEKEMHTKMYVHSMHELISSFGEIANKKVITGNRVAFLQVKHVDDLEYIPYKDGSWKFVDHNHYIDSGQVGIFDANDYGKMDENNKDDYYSTTMKLTLDSGNYGGIHDELNGAVSLSSYGDLSFSIFINESGTQIMCEHVMDEEDEDEEDEDDLSITRSNKFLSIRA